MGHPFELKENLLCSEGIELFYSKVGENSSYAGIAS